MSRDLLGGRASVHSLEALLHAAEEGQAHPSIPEISKKELADSVAKGEEGTLVEPEETVEPPEDAQELDDAEGDP
jgi:hypothetical protein